MSVLPLGSLSAQSAGPDFTHWGRHAQEDTLDRGPQPLTWFRLPVEAVYQGVAVTQKVLEHYLHRTQCMLPEIALNGHYLKFCSPDSYNPCNSC